MNPQRTYAPNGVIYEDGVAVGFHDSLESMGIMSDDELKQAKDFSENPTPETMPKFNWQGRTPEEQAALDEMNANECPHCDGEGRITLPFAGAVLECAFAADKARSPAKPSNASRKAVSLETLA